MTTHPHQVRRQVVEVHVSDERTAARIHPELVRIFGSAAVSVLDDACSALGHAEHRHRFDRVVVDLGRLDPGDVERQALTRLADRLPAALRAASPLVPGGITPSHRPEAETAPAVGPVEALPADTGAAPADTLPDPGSVAACAELLMLFACTGSLPWWADASDRTAVGEAVLLLSRHSPATLAAAVRAVARRPGARRRLVLNLDDAALAKIADALIGAREAASAFVELVVSSDALRAVEPRHRRVAAWAGLLRAAAGSLEIDRKKWGTFWEDAFAFAALEAGATATELAAGLAKDGDRHRLTEALHRLAVIAARSEWPALLDGALDGPGGAPARRTLRRSLRSSVLPHAVVARLVELLTPGTMSGLARTLIELRPAAAPGPTKKEDPAMADTPSSPSEDRGVAAERYPVPDTEEVESWAVGVAMPSEPDDYDEELDDDDDDAADDRVAHDVAHVDNAGLVLCAVFLPMLGHYLNLWNVDRRQWVGPAAPHRAAGLLQYLATGDEQPLEHQVTLNKVLCGLAPDAVFDFGGPVTDDELDACDDLFFSVMRNAEDALGELDFDDYRTRYFQRRGVLAAGGDSWLLRVERRDGDERLDQLPWPFRFLMLPWMEYPLQVEW